MGAFLRVLLLGWSAVVLSAGISSGQAATLVFTDWTSVDAGTGIATGQLGPVQVTFAGLRSGNYPWILDGTSTFFNASYFYPPLAVSDVGSFSGSNSSHTYTVTFSRPVEDVVLHLGSVASVLTFSGINPTRVGGESWFVVSGNTVTGNLYGGTGHNANGTIMLNGQLTAFSFSTIALAGVVSYDAMNLQLGAIVVPLPGDVDGDGHVDVVDLLYFVDAFGSATGDANFDPGCDFNPDGSVDVVDLLILVENFGT